MPFTSQYLSVGTRKILRQHNLGYTNLEARFLDFVLVYLYLK